MLPPERFHTAKTQSGPPVSVHLETKLGNGGRSWAGSRESLPWGFPGVPRGLQDGGELSNTVTSRLVVSANFEQVVNSIQTFRYS
jgi:hypothetical protein